MFTWHATREPQRHMPCGDSRVHAFVGSASLLIPAYSNQRGTKDGSTG
jgi:hypothetical protein